MAWGRNNREEVETITADELLELQERAALADRISPEKLIIIAGPTFGTVVKFLLFGAAIGALGATLFQGRGSRFGEDAIYEGLTAGGAKDGSTFGARAEALLVRAKELASRAKDAAQDVAEQVKPVIQDAINQRKAAAQENESSSGAVFEADEEA